MFSSSYRGLAKSGRFAREETGLVLLSNHVARSGERCNYHAPRGNKKSEVFQKHCSCRATNARSKMSQDLGSMIMSAMLPPKSEGKPSKELLDLTVAESKSHPWHRVSLRELVRLDIDGRQEAKANV